VDELVDYHGGSIRTYQDWECLEMMEDILRDEEFQSMSENDLLLLEEYAPKLFNTAPYKQEVVEFMMKELVRKLRDYRNGIGGFRFTAKEGVRLYSQKDHKVEQSLKDHATAILELLGDPSKGEIDYLTEKYHFFKELMNMAEHPEEFMSMDIKYKSASRTRITKLLQSYKLPKKTSTIKAFFKAIDN